jgi:hypothetical protein
MPKNGKYRDMVNINRTNVHFLFQTQRDFATIIEEFCVRNDTHLCLQSNTLAVVKNLGKYITSTRVQVSN